MPRNATLYIPIDPKLKERVRRRAANDTIATNTSVSMSDVVAQALESYLEPRADEESA